MIILAIISLIYSITILISVFTYKEEEDYSNLPISKETITYLAKGWIGIASLCGIFCALFILFL